jgi:hypothetical protein
LSRALKRYYGRLRRPPGSRPLPGSTPVIRRGTPTTPNRRLPGRGGPPQFPPPPSERSAPSTPGSSLGLQSRLFTPSVAFAVKDAARLSLPPTPTGQAAITTRQVSRDAADRSVAPPYRALDAGLRPGPFPDRPASLLPGLLAATRTGLTPAGGDELMLEQLLDDYLQRWAHSQKCCKFARGQVPVVESKRRSPPRRRCLGQLAGI